MVIMASGNRKKRKDGKSREEALEEAIKECENLLKKPKNPRKLVEYEFHREPITGIRETTTPYRPTPPPTTTITTVPLLQFILYI